MTKAGDLLLKTKSSSVRFILLNANSYERALLRNAIQGVIDAYSRNRFRHEDVVSDHVFRGSRDEELKLAVLHLRFTKSFCLSKISKRREEEKRKRLFRI